MLSEPPAHGSIALRMATVKFFHAGAWVHPTTRRRLSCMIPNPPSSTYSTHPGYPLPSLSPCFNTTRSTPSANAPSPVICSICRRQAVASVFSPRGVTPANMPVRSPSLAVCVCAAPPYDRTPDPFDPHSRPGSPSVPYAPPRHQSASISPLENQVATIVSPITRHPEASRLICCPAAAT